MYFNIFEEELYDPDLGYYITFGIEIFQNGKSADRISDISCDKEEISVLCERLNTDLPDPIHIRDIIEDFLSEVCDYQP